MTKAIIFDIGGVLEDSGSTRRIAQALSKKYGIDEEECVRIYQKNVEGIDRGTFSLAQYVEEVNKRFGTSITYKEFLPILHQAKLLNTEVIELAKKLKSRYTLYILSNNFPENVTFYKKRGFGKIFAKMFMSCDIGHIKPEKEIYECALKNIPESKESLLFIDDVEKNVKASISAGLPAIQFTTYESLLQELRKRNII
ncbi:HAD family phosphatase [Candidatus Woesearchaeota archaeon]|nr:HAD family phosphatase [Candidatus Woesearchaeota archaeon]